MDIFFMPHELAIAILHTAEKKSNVGEQATVQKKNSTRAPSGDQAVAQAVEGVANIGSG